LRLIGGLATTALQLKQDGRMTEPSARLIGLVKPWG